MSSTNRQQATSNIQNWQRSFLTLPIVKKQRRQRKLASQSQKHYHHTFPKEIIGQTITFLSNWNLRNTILKAYIICLVVLSPSSSLGLGRLYWKRYQTNPLCFLALTFPAGISAELILGFSYTYMERDVMKKLRNIGFFSHLYRKRCYEGIKKFKIGGGRLF